MASTADLIRTAVERFQAEVPALAKLKLVFGLELKAKHDIQLYRVELPGPKISKDLAQDERLLVEVDRPQFNELAEKGTMRSYRRAAETGHIKANGDSNVVKLIVQVVERHEERGNAEKSALSPVATGGSRAEPARRSSAASRPPSRRLVQVDAVEAARRPQSAYRAGEEDLVGARAARPAAAAARRPRSPSSAAISSVAARAVPGRMRPSSGGVTRAPSRTTKTLARPASSTTPSASTSSGTSSPSFASACLEPTRGRTTCGRPTSPRRSTLRSASPCSGGEEDLRVDRGRQRIEWRRLARARPALRRSAAGPARSRARRAPLRRRGRPAARRAKSVRARWRSSRARWASSATGRPSRTSSVSKRPRAGSGGGGAAHRVSIR